MFRKEADGGIRGGFEKYPVTSIWPTNPDQHLIFASEVRRDVPFTFTTVLTANYDINRSLITGIESELHRSAHENVRRQVEIRVNHYVSDLFQFSNTSLCLVLSNILKRTEFL